MGAGWAGMVMSVNVAKPRTVRWRGREVRTAIWKEPVAGPVAVRGVNVAGDEQGDRVHHGGPDKAVYAYAADDLAWWAGELDRDLGPGVFGENLTVAGMNVSGAVVGEHWRVGTVLVEVAQPRIPCFKLGIKLGDQRFVRRFAAAGRPGAYLRIVQDGEVAAGDPVELISRPAHGVTVGDVSRAYHGDRAAAPRLLGAPELPASWRRWASGQVA
jgi:MOSC domain-containing protein YiiM